MSTAQTAFSLPPGPAAQTVYFAPPPGPYAWRYRGQSIVRNYVAGEERFSVWLRASPCRFAFDSFVPSMVAAMARIDLLLVGSPAALEGEAA